MKSKDSAKNFPDKLKLFPVFSLHFFFTIVKYFKEIAAG